ncbi:hypothetical protein L6E12_18805 [Actinokineospora sp. PR83]|uniref:hypothetical protein n=1 Tax=Actinokineospora sp. PR83 TaxID=2884908 RepID=UPI001F3EAAA2|nr:hypothetical protein [Actinokineospora sp. PR83]MCG8917834.1 hypothetical protein [Actinokineospora sp. PR83]
MSVQSPPILQVALLIPPEIQLGLDARELVRNGGVVRDLLGQVVTHLKEGDLPSRGSGAAQRVAALLKDRRVVTTIVLSSAVGGTAATLAVKHRLQAKRCAKNLNASLITYLEAARDGTLDGHTIDCLLSDLSAAERYSKNGQVAVATALVDFVVDYTRKHAEANSFDLGELDEATPASEQSAVADLRRHVEAQRRIFSDAAR